MNHQIALLHIQSLQWHQQSDEAFGSTVADCGNRSLGQCLAKIGEFTGESMGKFTSKFTGKLQQQVAMLTCTQHINIPKKVYRF